MSDKTNTSANSGALRRLRCCCCDGDAGRWHQHWNRDNGHGVCVRCVTAARMSRVDEAEILSLYGAEGKNWGMSIVLYDRAFRVVAAFREDEQAQANRWMQAHPTHALLAIHEGLLLLSDINDKGGKPSAGMPIVRTPSVGFNEEKN